MRVRLFALAGLCVVGLCLCARLLGEEGPKRLQGQWQVTGLVIDGRDVSSATQPARALDGFKLVIEGSRFTYFMIVNGKEHQIDLDVATDVAKTPHVLDAKLLGGAFKGKVCQGIYELEGDTLRLCLPDKPGTKRPAKLESKPGSLTQLITLERMKTGDSGRLSD